MSIPLAIVGSGKMGRLVEQFAPEYGFDVRAAFSRSNIGTLSHESLAGAVVAIEFTAPGSAAENLARLASLGVNTVCGTTGWYEELPQIRKVFADAHTALVFGANFSVGVNLFLRLWDEPPRCLRNIRNTKRGGGRFIIPRRKMHLQER